MTGPTVALLALSAATLLPASPRRRLGRVAAPARGIHRRLLIAAGCAAGCAVVAAAGLPPVAATLAATLLGATVAGRSRRRSRRRRDAAEAAALEAALEVVVGELRIGAHPVRAFEAAALEAGQRSVAAGLRTVAARARLGADVAAGLRSVAAASSLPTQWERLAVYWQLGSEHGLAIATLMRAAQRDIAERQRFSEQVNSGLAGARASAAILAALPILGVLLGQLVGARPLGFLFSRDGGGFLVAGVALVAGGMLWSDRITERLT
ncbi:MAG TPA: type II secretion system F family protein [Mycobacterium sp.]